jgi:hypothetical protein
LFGDIIINKQTTILNIVEKLSAEALEMK